MRTTGQFDDLLTNFQGGTEGLEDFLDIPSGDGASDKVKRAKDIPDAASEFPLTDLFRKKFAHTDTRSIGRLGNER